MELRPNQNHRVPVFAPLGLEGVEHRSAVQVPFWFASGYFRHWAGDGRHKRSRRQIQDETEETGACKICITLILDSKTQRCGAGGRAARRGMGSLSTLS